MTFQQLKMLFLMRIGLFFIENVPIIELSPKKVFENHGKVSSIPKISGEMAPPILPPADASPNALPRTHVGYSSAE